VRASRASGRRPLRSAGRHRRPRGVGRAFVCALALALLAVPSGAVRLLLDVGEATFRWSPASGPVDGYVVMASRDGGPSRVEEIVVDPRVTLPTSVGESLVVTVRAVGRRPDGSLALGPASRESEEIRVLSMPDFERSGLWTLHCAPCGELALQPFSEPAPVVRIAAPGPGWSYGGLGWLGGVLSRIWLSGEYGALALWDASARPQVIAWEQRGSLAERRLVGPVDLDGDGIEELLLHDVDGAAVDVWRLRGSEALVAARLPGLPGATLALADVVGDDRIDLVWHLHGGGAVVAWTLDGFARADVYRSGTQADPGAALADTADYDGDGRDELLWRTPAGALSVWYLEAGSLARVARLPAVHDDAHRRAVGAADFDGYPGSEIVMQDDRTGDIHVLHPLIETYPARALALQPGRDWRVVDVDN